MFLHHLLLSTQCLPRWGLEGRHLNRALKHSVEPKKKKVTLRRGRSRLLKPPQMCCQSLSPLHQVGSCICQTCDSNTIWLTETLRFRVSASARVFGCVGVTVLRETEQQRRDTRYRLAHCQGHVQHFATTSPSAVLELKQ